MFGILTVTGLILAFLIARELWEVRVLHQPRPYGLKSRAMFREARDAVNWWMDRNEAERGYRSACYFAACTGMDYRFENPILDQWPPMSLEDAKALLASLASQSWMPRRNQKSFSAMDH